ncbi:MAG: fatty acid desaturase [Betaproteobacteria bacterium]|nr:fatty acid desaturase [Betaproteobacteria bacterium]
MKLFRSPAGALPNTIALTCTLGGYATGIWLLTSRAWSANVLGVLLTAHTLILAAYFIHEFAHQSIFRSAEANNRWGEVMSWIAGSCYAPFAALRRKHMRHHLDRADIVTFDYKAFLRRSPPWVSRFVLALEWLYVPAVEFIMHGYVMALPFLKPERRAERARLVTILAIRLGLFGLLAAVSWRAVLLYAVAYMIMLHVLRFADAFQHTYDAFAVLESGAVPDAKVRDRAYEQANTYSNLVSVAHPWLNLLLLNFSYHNAHHERPVVPWHDLPRLHAEIFPADYRQVIPMAALLRGYHRDRLRRITSDDYGEVGTGARKADGFLGAAGVSFLTAV